MAVPSTTAFLNRFPEFAEQATSVVEGALAEAANSTPATVWGAVHTEGVSYLAAHLLASRTMQLGLQVGTPSGQPLGTSLDATLYGQAYQRLLRTLPLSGFTI
jgi:hypothetical protein